MVQTRCGRYAPASFRRSHNSYFDSATPQKLIGVAEPKYESGDVCVSVARRRHRLSVNPSYERELQRAHNYKSLQKIKRFAQSELQQCLGGENFNTLTFTQSSENL